MSEDLGSAAFWRCTGGEACVRIRCIAAPSSRAGRCQAAVASASARESIRSALRPWSTLNEALTRRVSA